MKDRDLHDGISKYRIRVGDGVVGFIVVARSCASAWPASPMLRYFLGFAIVIGVGVACGLIWCVGGGGHPLHPVVS